MDGIIGNYGKMQDFSFGQIKHLIGIINCIIDTHFTCLELCVLPVVNILEYVQEYFFLVKNKS